MQLPPTRYLIAGVAVVAVLAVVVVLSAEKQAPARQTPEPPDEMVMPAVRTGSARRPRAKRAGAHAQAAAAGDQSASPSTPHRADGDDTTQASGVPAEAASA